MINKMEKKAHAFALGLVLITLMISGYIYYSFATTNRIAKTNLLSPTKLTDMQDEKTKFIFYVQESAKLAAEQAFYDIASKGAGISECQYYNNYIIWSDKCKPNSEIIEQDFLSSFKDSFGKFMEDYGNDKFKTQYSFSLENNKIEIKANDIILETSDEKGYVKYNAKYSFNPSLTIDLADLNLDIGDFAKIYDSAMLKYDKCKNEDDVKACMSDLEIKGWQSTIEDEENYLLFNLNTGQNYFFVEEDMEFSQINLKFALKS